MMTEVQNGAGRAASRPSGGVPGHAGLAAVERSDGDNARLTGIRPVRPRSEGAA